MKQHVVLLFVLLLNLAFLGCKKDTPETITPKITNDKVETTATTATFTWTVDWPGKLISVVEVSENEDMSHSQIYGSETETGNHGFTVTVSNLKVVTKYYYRYLVWNKYYEDNKFEMEKKSFVTPVPELVSDNVETTATTATFTWTVDWPGKLISVVEMSENEDMSDSRFYGFEEETENHNFEVTAIGLKEGTIYYYRYLVWNKFYADNKFVMEGKDCAVKTDWPNGRLPGMFSISSTKKAYFSQGNLQYRASTNTWRFANYQWDFVGTQTPDCDGNVGGTVNGSDNADISQSYNGWIDLFGWGTSGWNNGNTYFRPWDDAGINYASSYGPPGCYDLTGSYAKADWGVYNPISNGGNTANIWRILTKDEWDYVLNTRSTLSGIRFACAIVNNVNGVILLPDNWDNYTIDTPISQGHDYNSNLISFSTWASMEINGAVFLPAAGERWNSSLSYVYSPGGIVSYWSASCDDNMSSRAYFIDRFGRVNPVGRHYGYSVRLVHDVE